MCQGGEEVLVLKQRGCQREIVVFEPPVEAVRLFYGGLGRRGDRVVAESHCDAVVALPGVSHQRDVFRIACRSHMRSVGAHEDDGVVGQGLHSDVLLGGRERMERIHEVRGGVWRLGGGGRRDEQRRCGTHEHFVHDFSP